MFWDILIVLALFCVSIISIAVGSMFLDEREESGLFAFFALLFGLFLVCLLCYSVAPNRFGVGYVAENFESYTRRLTDGGAYEVITMRPTRASAKSKEDVPYQYSMKDQPGYVLLLRAIGTETYYTIRVAGEPPPERFTLVEGEPVALN